MKLTKEMVKKALADYDKNLRRSPFDSGTGYSLIYNKKHYPPKEIYRICTGLERGEFNSLKAKRLFESLDFVVERVDSPILTSTRVISPKEVLSKSNEEITSIIFKRKWCLLENWKKLKDLKWPGVYLIAFTSKNLEGETVKPEDVFYIGMTHAGLKKRLIQFMKGIDQGTFHSGGMRFFNEYLKEKSWKGSLNGKRLYIASLGMECETNKNKRRAEDLLVMGRVSALEFHCLAYVKERTGQEPELNKK